MGIMSWTEDYGDEIFMNLNMSKLGRDEAYLNVTNASPATVYLYSVYKECSGCPFTKKSNIAGNATLTISTRFAQMWRVLAEDVQTSPLNSNRSVLCTLDPDFGEFGVYSLTVSDKTCQLDTLKEPVNIYFPILTVILIYALLAIFVSSFVHVWKVYMKKAEREMTSYDKDLENSQQKRRVQSLDTFRGISIVLMIFVNYGCGGYEVLDHAVWNGLQLSDLLFPWFMWIMGACIPISTASIIKRGTSKKSSLLNILRRSCILFGLGLFLGAGVYLNKLRVFGVLQRFGVCYFVAASVFILLPTGRTAPDDKKNMFAMWKDVFALKYQWMVAVFVLIVHNLFTFMLSIPDCPSGYLGPGGDHDNRKYLGCTGGAAGYIDKVVLGNHRYHWPTIRQIYQSGPFDPEGILGCLTSTLQVIIGAQAGAIVLHYKEHSARLVRWLVWGVVLGIIGGALCGFSKDDGLIPINKNLWSLSFVMVTSSLAFLLLALCYYLIDVKNYWSGKPFLFAGMNAILMYVGHSMTYGNFPIRWVPDQDIGLSTHFVSLAENIWGTGMWVLIAYYLYRIKFFLTI